MREPDATRRVSFAAAMVPTQTSVEIAEVNHAVMIDTLRRGGDYLAP